jgi:hypothetical protein
MDCPQRRIMGLPVRQHGHVSCGHEQRDWASVNRMTVDGRTATVAFGAGTLSMSASGGSFQLGGAKSIILTAPTISSGFGTSPSIASNNFSSTFRVNVGTGGVATSGVVGLPTASNGWNCVVQDLSTNVVTRQTASNTTTVTVTAASAWTASDILIFICAGY